MAHRTGAIGTRISSAWWWTPPCRRRRSRIRPMRGSSTGRSRSWSRLAKREGVGLRQSYLRVAKRAAIMVGRYTHAHQFKRARRELKFLRTRLGRIIRDIRRKIEGDAALAGSLRSAARSCIADSPSRAAPTRTKGLLMARPRGGVHRPRQGTDAVRVRLQGVDCHASHRTQRRTVRAACQGAAWQSVRRPHARSRHH